jgi:hypothetical protein
MSAFFSSRTGRRVLSDAEEFERWNDLPYGVWTCADGREVIFNRFYEPIWERKTGQAPVPADPSEWVNWESQGWFYDDRHKEAAKRKRAEIALKAFYASQPLDPFETVAALKKEA